MVSEVISVLFYSGIENYQLKRWNHLMICVTQWAQKFEHLLLKKLNQKKFWLEMFASMHQFLAKLFYG
jgi:hypothetical protein